MEESRPEFDVKPYLNGPFAEQMFAQYGEAYFSELLSNIDYAPLAHQPGNELIAYTTLGYDPEATEQMSLLYVPGFTENMIGKATTGLEFAKQGFDVILPHYNSAPAIKDAAGKKDATRTRALDLLAIIEQEGLTDSPVHVATHSYGALVFDEMLKIAKDERGWTCFDGIEVAMTAPAGIHPEKSWLNYGKRFLKSQLTEKKEPQDSPDQAKVMEKASTQSIFANLRRSIREVREIKGRQVDMPKLLGRGIGYVTILGFSRDKMFPDELLTPAIQKIMINNPDAKLAYAQPISFRYRNNGNLVGVEGATHNDDSFTPRRVVGAIKAVLQSRHPANGR